MKPTCLELLAEVACTDETCGDHCNINDLAARVERVLALKPKVTLPISERSVGFALALEAVRRLLDGEENP